MSLVEDRRERPSVPAVSESAKQEPILYRCAEETLMRIVHVGTIFKAAQEPLTNGVEREVFLNA